MHLANIISYHHESLYDYENLFTVNFSFYFILNSKCENDSFLKCLTSLKSCYLWQNYSFLLIYHIFHSFKLKPFILLHFDCSKLFFFIALILAFVIFEELIIYLHHKWIFLIFFLYFIIIYFNYLVLLYYFFH
jgi:hypothetical protein